MRNVPMQLLNTGEIELWPGGLLRARRSSDARILSRAQVVLRRKRDGRYLAAKLPETLVPLVPGLLREPGIRTALGMLDRDGAWWRPGSTPRDLPLGGLHQRLETLGLDDRYGERSGLPLVAEPDRLALGGFDRYRRPLWLHAQAARAWSRMHAAALRDGMVLEAISGYRSHDYQLGIFERKRARGQAVADILAVNAAPGYSEHHSGRALDISAPDEPAAEESFERTPAFHWLAAHAGDFGFAMSYPRDNPHGIVYEPWHWCWQPMATGIGESDAPPIPASA